MIEPFAAPLVRGFLHRPEQPSGDAIVLTHGAGSNCQSPLLVEIAREFAGAGLLALRCDLPFRQTRPSGPPSPGGAAKDREGLRAAVDAVRQIAKGRVYLGGHSYGGRQATMLAAANVDVADALLLFSYPLHPPRRLAELRTSHFPQILTPAVFVHGSRDPFGTLEEMRAALALIPAPTELVGVEGAGHDLKSSGAVARALKHFLAFTFSRYNSDKQL
jgi:predicted alpha/beta-hydrolase family hydrolase